MVADALLRHPDRCVVTDTRPEGFLTIGDWGCSISVEVDIESGRVYLVGCWDELWLDENVSKWLIDIHLAAPSLEDWFEGWLDGSREGQLPTASLTRDLVDVPDGTDAAAVFRDMYWFDPPGWRSDWGLVGGD